MGVQEVAESFASAFNSGDFDTVASYLTDDFQFSGPMPQPLSAQEWVGTLHGFKAAFPDIKYNLKIVSVEGNTVKTTTQLTGTHTGDLDLTAMGMAVIPPTGKSFSMPEESGETTVEGEKVKALTVDPAEGGGLMGILAQLGVQPPS